MRTAIFTILAALSLPAVAHAEGAPGESTTVKAVGQAAITTTDLAHARDKAIEDAMRKAVEQAVGAMVSSETVTQNFELISDKILSKSRGYVRTYKVLNEKKEEGIYEVTIEAVVASGNLHNDLDGVLAVLRAKNMPRVLIMVSEQNVGQAGAAFWWGSKGAEKGGATLVSTNLDVVENAFIDSWTPKGLTFVDRQTLLGKLSTGPALTSAEPSDDAVKQFGLMAGAELVVIGKAVATDVGPIMNTQMHSVRANISVRALNLDTGEILCTSTQTQAVGHVDPTTGGTQALMKVAQRAADDMLQKILAKWEGQVSGPSNIKLTLHKVAKTKWVRNLTEVLRRDVRGVAEVRQRNFKGGEAELEVSLKGSAQDLADALESGKYDGFTVNIDEVTANAVVATLK